MKKFARASRILLASVAAAAGLAATPVFAQDYDEDGIVVSPYNVQRERGRNSASDTYYLSATVTTKGLDLRRDADVEELYRRVDATAWEVCEVIEEEMRGDSTTSDRQCVRRAVDGAMPQVEAAIYRQRG